MATKTETPTAMPTVPVMDPAVIEEATAKMKDLGDKMVASMKTTGLVSLDAYEKAVASMVDLQEKAAKATGLDWVVTATATQTALVKDLSGAYTKAVRETLA